MTKWFGESWGAPVNEDCSRVETPVGRECGRCEKPIAEGDIGFVFPFQGVDASPTTLVYHHACFLREVGVAHLVPSVRAIPMAEALTRIEETNCPKCQVTLDALSFVTSAAPWVSGLCPACGCGIRARRA